MEQKLAYILGTIKGDGLLNMIKEEIKIQRKKDG